MLSVVIQAGGESRRMGQDKARLPFRGQPLIARVYQRLAGIGEEILITTNNGQGYPFLEARAVADLLPGCGALGGLYTALSAASYPAVAVTACDMPFVSAGLMLAELDWLIEREADLVVPQSPGGLEPFHAVYRRESCLPRVLAALQAGKRRVDAWFGQVKVVLFPIEESRKHDPELLCFQNINTPEDLERARGIAEGDAAGERLKSVKRGGR